jgi:hypothetical protein
MKVYHHPPRPKYTGKETEYWTISRGHANRTGFSCRQCKIVINQNEPVVVRDGRKMRFFYHEECFSGNADPRSQDGSSYGQYRGIISEQAPEVKGYGKWAVLEYGYNGYNSGFTTFRR